MPLSTRLILLVAAVTAICNAALILVFHAAGMTPLAGAVVVIALVTLAEMFSIGVTIKWWVH